MVFINATSRIYIFKIAALVVCFCTSDLTGLGKVFDREELNIKILKCLDRSWQPKVTASCI